VGKIGKVSRTVMPAFLATTELKHSHYFHSWYPTSIFVCAGRGWK